MTSSPNSWIWLLLSTLLAAAALRPSAAQAEDAADADGARSARTETFAFEVGGHRLVGLLDVPWRLPATATIILVHGYGRTDVVAQNGYADLRDRFAGIGLNVLVWDKPGCGQSEGEFDIDQSVDSSADEVVAAVHALRARGIAGSERVGLWGISRAGWIAPLAIAAEPSIGFWISVSGVDDKENARYLLASNLPIEGRSAAETARLVAAWQRGFDSVWRGGSYQDYLDAATELAEDPFLQFMGWGQPVSEQAFHAYRARFERGELGVDEHSALAVYVPDFAAVLSSLDIPVLALFGERDTNVDWRRTADLYRETIGSNPAAELTVRVFAGANHNLRQAATGGVREMFAQPGNAPHADGYFDAMTDWLVARGLGSRPP